MGRRIVEDVRKHVWWKYVTAVSPGSDFWPKGECWLWKKRNRDGDVISTPMVNHLGKLCSLRRLAFYEFVRPVSEEEHVINGEKCEPNCVNPWHADAMLSGDAHQIIGWRIWDTHHGNSRDKSFRLPSDDKWIGIPWEQRPLDARARSVASIIVGIAADRAGKGETWNWKTLVEHMQGPRILRAKVRVILKGSSVWDNFEES